MAGSPPPVHHPPQPERLRYEAHRQRIAEMRNTLIQKILTSGEKMRGVGEDDDDPSALWPRHDEFCHAHGHGHDEHEHGHSESH